nr:MAG: CHASE2 domain-containing protein [Leptolyngbya sp. IPPAS B-1204]
MSQLVILNLGRGSWQQGFPSVTAQVWESGTTAPTHAPTQFTGSLPPAPEIPDLYQQWQLLYQALHRRLGRLNLGMRGIELDEMGVTNVSEADFHGISQQLKRELNCWLGASSFGKIERQLRTVLVPAMDLRVVIETDDLQLRQFPWHLWNFLEDYPQAEISLAVPDHKRVDQTTQRLAPKVKILAVLGNSEGIDIQKDREFLAQLPGAEVVFLVEASRQQLNHQLWDERGWDILFFAGHSSSLMGRATGEIAINRTEHLTIEQLKHALKAAIDRGLKFAIFNSCDGLGLAKAMADLNIPQLVVMREPVPDQVAQEFLKYLLTAFSGGKSFYRSVREAREKLQGLENDFPGASWLPVICQNPAETPLSWKQLRDGVEATKKRFTKDWFQTVLLTSIVVLAVVLGVRQIGGFQSLELAMYDQLLRWRPQTEPPDPRLLVITVTQADVQAQTERQGSSLSNKSLAQLLDQLEPLQPAVIGLDIYRDFAIEPQYRRLAEQLSQNQPRLIAVCYAGATDAEPGIPPPPNIPTAQLQQRVGFSDFPVDLDGSIRRHLLGQAPPEKSACQSQLSFSFLLATAYLQQHDPNLQIQWNPTDVRIGPTTFPAMESNAGGYQGMSNGGYQVLLNYRASNQIAEQLTLDDVLNRNQLTPDLVQGRIILIGTTDSSYKDFHQTPYSKNLSEQMAGVLVQAHMVSQILSTVQDKRPLIWWLPEWGEIVWIWVWALLGSVIAYHWRSEAAIWLAAGCAVLVLFGCCYGLILQAGWVPLVPPAFAIVTAAGILVIYTRVQAKQQ